MKKLSVILSLFLLCSNCGWGQEIEWSKTYGGEFIDNLNAVIKTSDGGYALGGTRFMRPYQNITLRDNEFYFGLIKINKQGKLLWSKIYGTGNDHLSSIDQTRDNGYVLAGHSYDRFGSDYFVIKVDKNGKQEWMNKFGGLDSDYANEIHQTPDKGFIIAGDSKSNNGDVSENYWNYDIWVIKLDPQGNLEWEQNYGGSERDGVSSLKRTTDGGYIMAGYTKSEDHDVSSHNRWEDFWIIKLSKSGSIQWERTYGGPFSDEAFSIQSTYNGGYIVAGNSNNNFWIIKIDKKGNMKWDKKYVGSGEEWATSIKQTAEGGYIVAGHSNSDDGDVSNNYGKLDYWVVKLITKET
jgi:hypothetical protein